MSTLERAIAIAASAHEGQTDRAGAAYVLHPLRVMLSVDGYEERIAAVLHDVLEDTAITADYLRAEGFSDAIMVALSHLSKQPGEKYEAFIERVAANSIARRVKLADLIDNSDLGRIACPTNQDYARVAKYQKAITFLQGTSR